MRTVSVILIGIVVMLLLVLFTWYNPFSLTGSVGNQAIATANAEMFDDAAVENQQRSNEGVRDYDSSDHSIITAVPVADSNEPDIIATSSQADSSDMLEFLGTGIEVEVAEQENNDRGGLVDSESDVADSSSTESGLLRPHQVVGRVFPAPNLDVLAGQLSASQQRRLERFQIAYPDLNITDPNEIALAAIHQRHLRGHTIDPVDRQALLAWSQEYEGLSRVITELHAADMGLSIGGVDDTGRGYFLRGFSNGVPEYIYTINQSAADATNTRLLRMNPDFDPSVPLLTGTGLYVNVNDHGEIFQHAEFQLPGNAGSRIVVAEVPSYSPASREHMTHVAGTIGAWGYTPALTGMAPRVWIRSLIQQDMNHVYNYAMSNAVHFRKSHNSL